MFFNKKLYIPYDKFFYIISFPRSGNTWVVNSLKDYLGAQRAELMPSVYGGEEIKFYGSKKIKVAGAYDTEKPVGIKTHMYKNEFQKEKLPKHKIVYILRDGRDVLISYYFYTYGFLGKDKERVKNFSNDDFSDFLRKESMNYRNHIIGWFEFQNIFKIKYEELKNNYIHILSNIQKYLNIVNLITEDEVKEKYVDNFKGMDKNLNALQGDNTAFYRKGIIGDWENYFNEENKSIFKEYCGQLLIDLGYEKDTNW